MLVASNPSEQLMILPKAIVGDIKIPIITTSPVDWSSNSHNWATALPAMADAAEAQNVCPEYAPGLRASADAIVTLNQRRPVVNPASLRTLNLPDGDIRVGVAVTLSRLAEAQGLSKKPVIGDYHDPKDPYQYALEDLKLAMVSESAAAQTMVSRARKANNPVSDFFGVLKQTAPNLSACVESTISALVLAGGEYKGLSDRQKMIYRMASGACGSNMQMIPGEITKEVGRRLGKQRGLPGTATQMMQPIPRSVADSAIQTHVPVRAGA